MNSATYDSDILEWSEEQARALRNLARSRPDLSNELDWENVAEEIECVGRSEFAAVRSHILQILIHVIKGVSVPDSASMLHWRKEVVAFHGDLLDGITPSMRVRLDLPRLWREALKRGEADLATQGQSVAPILRERCLLAPDDLLDPDFDFLKVVGTLRRQIDAGRPSIEPPAR